jgi:hypothetical protein
MLSDFSNFGREKCGGGDSWKNGYAGVKNQINETISSEK